MKTIFTSKEKNTVCGRKGFYFLITTVLTLSFTNTTFAQNDSTSNNLNTKSAPVILGQFTGGYSSGIVQLNWTTINEANVSHFEIERSTDGTNFRQIGKVLARGDNQSTTNYAYLDILAEKGSNFYRLVLIDRDGNFTYSKLITIGVEKGISLFVVYPNPFGKKVQVKFNSDEQDKVTMRIVNESGTVMRTQTDPTQKGENIITIQNVDNLPGGIYYLEVITKDRNMRTKLMKQQN